MAGFGPDGRIYIANSSGITMATCSTKSWLEINGYTTAKEAPELLAGSSLHHSMHQYHRTGSKLEALEILEHEYRPWAEGRVPFFDRLHWKSVRMTLARWYEEHPIERLPYTVDPTFSERQFLWPLTPDGENVLLGYPDHIGRLRHNRAGLAIVDHKSTKAINQYFKDQFTLDPQITNYWWLTERLFGEPVAVFYVNAIELKAVWNDNGRKCRDHRVPWSKCAIKHSLFHIFSYQRSPAQVTEWHRNMVIQAQRMRRMLEVAPDLGHLHKVRMDGMLRNHCKWCWARNFCENNRPVNRINDYLIKSPAPVDPIPERLAA